MYSESLVQAAEGLSPPALLHASWSLYRATWVVLVLWFGWSLGSRVLRLDQPGLAAAHHLLVLLAFWGIQSIVLLFGELEIVLEAGPTPTWRAGLFGTWQVFFVCLLMVSVVVAVAALGTLLHSKESRLATPIAWAVCLVIVITVVADWAASLFFLTPFEFRGGA